MSSSSAPSWALRPSCALSIRPWPVRSTCSPPLSSWPEGTTSSSCPLPSTRATTAATRPQSASERLRAEILLRRAGELATSERARIRERRRAAGRAGRAPRRQRSRPADPSGLGHLPTRYRYIFVGDILTLMSDPLREPTFLILAALAPQPLHGYGIIGEVAALSGERLSLRPGTLYGALDRLADEGLVEPDRQEVVDGRLRRYYRLTEAGAGLLEAEAQRLRRNADTAQQRLARRRERAAPARPH